MSINLKTIINNKLKKTNISSSSLLVFNRNLDIIINSNKICDLLTFKRVSYINKNRPFYLSQLRSYNQ